jgi:hypothetical protein
MIHRPADDEYDRSPYLEAMPTALATLIAALPFLSLTGSLVWLARSGA